MVRFAQRYRAIKGYSTPSSTINVKSTSNRHTASYDSQLSQLMSMVAVIAEKQNSLEERLQQTEASHQIQNKKRGQCSVK